jgi:hypothetical protein
LNTRRTPDAVVEARDGCPLTFTRRIRRRATTNESPRRVWVNVVEPEGESRAGQDARDEPGNWLDRAVADALANLVALTDRYCSDDDLADLTALVRGKPGRLGDVERVAHLTAKLLKLARERCD